MQRYLSASIYNMNIIDYHHIIKHMQQAALAAESLFLIPNTFSYIRTNCAYNDVTF